MHLKQQASDSARQGGTLTLSWVLAGIALVLTGLVMLARANRRLHQS